MIPHGIIVKGVTFSPKANPLYPSTTEIDFIMCLRYSLVEVTTLNFN